MERVKGTFKQNGSLQTRRKNEGKKIEKGRKKKEKKFMLKFCTTFYSMNFEQQEQKEG